MGMRRKTSRSQNSVPRSEKAGAAPVEWKESSTPKSFVPTLPPADVAASNHPKWIGLGLILVAVILGLLVARQTEDVPLRKSASTDVSDAATRKKLESMVNRHVQLTNRRIEIEKEQIKIEANFVAPRVGEFVLDKSAADQPTFNQRADRNEMNAARDLARDSHYTVSANDIIQQEVAGGGRRVAGSDEEYRKEYARQFVENARRNGYEVQLSSDYRVIGVRQVPVENRATGNAYR